MEPGFTQLTLTTKPQGHSVFCKIPRPLSRKSQTFLATSRAQILQGAGVMSDEWSSYECLQDESYEQPKLRTPKHRF